MKQRKLGSHGPLVGQIGLGCMSFAGTMSGPTDAETSMIAMDKAWETGITHFDTANVYGPHRSEQVVGQWIATRGHRPSLATKAGITRDQTQPVNNDPAYLRAELEGSLQRLGVDHVDLFYVHRRDPTVPVEDIAGMMGQLIDHGKIGGWGLSEIAPTTLRRAHAETPVMAVQNEYSLWTRQPELGLLQDCAKYGIAFVAFSPLARGVFGRQVIDPKDADFGQFRASMPRFQAENWTQNKERAIAFQSLAAAQGVTTTGLALAWVLAQGDHIIPIPGTRTADHMQDWSDADQIILTPQLRLEITEILPIGWAWGDRYNAAQSKAPERYC